MATKVKTISARQRIQNIRMHFARVRGAEKRYLIKLVAVARQVGLIVRGFAPDGTIENLEGLMETLTRYEHVLEPWAREVSSRMLLEVSRRDQNAWNATAAEIGQSLRTEIESAPTGHVMQTLLAEQVDVIKSLPRTAAQRLYDLATEVVLTGRRAEVIQREILETEDVTVARAKMLARTAVSTASASIVEARALYVGSPGYFWRTSKDSDVRNDHHELEGTFHRWDDPPVVDKRSGFRSHPGCNANCRCWPQVVLPEPE